MQGRLLSPLRSLFYLEHKLWKDFGERAYKEPLPEGILGSHANTKAFYIQQQSKSFPNRWAKLHESNDTIVFYL